MSLAVSKEADGQYTVELAEPEKLWQEIIAGKLMCEDVTVLCLAISLGLIELFKNFVRPAGTEDVT